MKFMGSKSKIAKEILPIILKDRKEGQWYVEPFLGGCNSMEYVSGNRMGGDANEYLIAMWQDLLNGREFTKSIPKEEYVFQRVLYHEGVGDKGEIGWVGFMGSFNGRFFDGGYSGHNVKIQSGTRDYIAENIKNTLAQIPKLKGLHLFACDYKSLPIPPNSIIYVDPPYYHRKEYTDKVNHEELWQWCREKTLEGHKVYISEYNAPKDFKCVWEKKVSVAINQTRTKRPTEKLFIYNKSKLRYGK